MPVSPEYREWILEQLETVPGSVTSRSMFGGCGLYLDGVFFALIADDILYFKVDESNRPDFESAGTGPFRPYRDRDEVMQYYEVPADVLEDRPRLAEWARRAAEVARRAKLRGKKRG